MKNLLCNVILLICIVLAGSCGQAEDKTKIEDEPSVTSTPEIVDTSGYFIRGILNASPKDVAKVLGDPDYKIKESNDCDYLPSCNETTYQNGKYEVLYYKEKLKWITVNKKGHFNKNAVRYIGFQYCEPTLANKFGIHWRNEEEKGTASGPLVPIPGLRQICAFPDYLLVTVEADYNQKF